MVEYNPAALPEGAVFQGRYQIMRRLKAGGMGAIYECVHLATRKHRALKVMLPEIITSRGMRERFDLEARVTSEIESDHIVETFDAGVDDATGAPFLVMELLHGEDLEAALVRQGRFSAAETVKLLSQAALALDRTHAAGIVHRDLKPQNLFLTTRDDGSPRLKILDFGIAKVIAASTKSAHQTAAIGTPLYMAPEQATGDGTIGATADHYALAHIAYTLLVGEAFWAEECKALPVLSFLKKVVEGQPEPPSARAARRGVTLPAAFDAWFAHATALAPRDRFDHASTQITELSTALGTAAPPIGLSTPPRGPSSSQTDSDTLPAPTRTGSQPRIGSQPPIGPRANEPRTPMRPLEERSSGETHERTLQPLMSTRSHSGEKHHTSTITLGLAGAAIVAALGVGGLLLVRRAPSNGGAPAARGAESAMTADLGSGRSEATVEPTSASSVAPLASAPASPSASTSANAPHLSSSSPSAGSVSPPGSPKNTAAPASPPNHAPPAAHPPASPGGYRPKEL